MTSRKPCINVTTATYSGKELSPLHYGLSAEGYDIDTILEGHDKLMWITKIKNNRKVWIRHSIPNRMVHEQQKEEVESKESDGQDKMNNIGETDQQNKEVVDNAPKDIPIVVCIPTVPNVMKPVVEEKKLTAYNMFLTYRLHELKKLYSSTDVVKPNKEVFNDVVAQWKALDKKSEEYATIMKAAEEFSKFNKA